MLKAFIFRNCPNERLVYGWVKLVARFFLAPSSELAFDKPVADHHDEEPPVGDEVAHEV